MLRRVEGEQAREPSLLDVLGFGKAEPIVAAVPQAEMETALLPHDHPQWVRDALSVSNRARELIGRLKPVVIAVLTFWDHRIRSAFVSGSRVSIDASGSYRAE